MSVRRFLGGLGIVALLLFAVGVWRVVNQWEYQTIGSFQVRRNLLWGTVQLKTGDDWRASFVNDRFAPPISDTDLRRVRIVDVAWGRDGILCARALVAPGAPIKGRLALRVQIQEVHQTKHIRDQSVRQTVDWPAGGMTPFALRTGLSAPGADDTNLETVVTLQPTLYSGD